MVRSNMSFDSEPAESIRPSCGVPRRLLQHLLFGHGLGVGARVLEVGTVHESLTPLLFHLGIDAWYATHCVESLAQMRRTLPAVESHRVDDLSNPPWPARQFDAVLVRDLLPWRENLLGADAFAATAGLLSTLRPGGHLVHFAKFQTSPGQVPTGHGIGCYARHLSCFPGACRVIRVRERWSLGALRDRLFRQGLRTSHKMASLQIPHQPLSRQEWRRFSLPAGLNGVDRCCEWACPAPVAAPRRAA